MSQVVCELYGKWKDKDKVMFKVKSKGEGKGKGKVKGKGKKSKHSSQYLLMMEAIMVDCSRCHAHPRLLERPYNQSNM